MTTQPTMFQPGSFIAFRDGSGTPFKVEIAVHFSEFGDAMPESEQSDEYNVYAFRGEHGRMIYAFEYEVKVWTPQSDIEAWISQDLARLWPRYLLWRRAADRLGIPVEDLIDRKAVTL